MLAPKKRPKSSYRRFQADQPNECWQSDFTHWQLADHGGVEIINWLDDHSRLLLTAVARRRISGDDVVATFLAALHPDRQRVGLHLPLHRRPQRLFEYLIASATDESVFHRLTRACGWAPAAYADLITRTLNATLGRTPRPDQAVKG